MIRRLDAAMGTALLQRLPDESHADRARAALRCPDVVATIHRLHHRAGARVLTSHTFSAHTFGDATLRAVSEAAVRILRDLRDLRDGTDLPSFEIAGSIGPLPPGVASTPAERIRRYADLGNALVTAGVDVLRLETMTGWDDARLATQACSGLGKPLWLGLACGPNGALLGGERLDVPSDLDPEVAVWIVQCTEAAGLEPALHELDDGHRRLGLAPSTAKTTDAGFFPNAQDELELARRVADLAREHRTTEVVGGCCGTTSRYLAALASALEPT